MRNSWRLLAVAVTTACNSTTPTAPVGDFTFSVGDFSPADVRPGDTTSLPLFSAFRNGFQSPVGFAFEGPSGFTTWLTDCRTILTPQPFGPAAGASCTAMIRVDSTVTAGTHSLVFTATSASAVAKRISAPLAILPPRPLPQTFSVTPSTRALTIRRGDSADVVFVLSARPVGAAPVTFTVLGNYLGIGLQWRPSSVVPAGNDTVRVRITVRQDGVVGGHSYLFQAQLPGKPTYSIPVSVTIPAG
ncbi:hypothetical protein [Gemmatimonas phototrophica]|nr:hypothetical protein [Gemmatimonas phototrophica]